MRQSRFLPLMGHELHVSEWGSFTNTPLVMWHGLARTGRDFDELAEALSDRYFVLCPDTIGRGLSTWADDPATQYMPAHYAKIALAMLDHYAIQSADWIGTSLGGLIGMHIASGPDAHRLRSLVINDIGPEIPAPAVERIVTYAADLPEFDTMKDAENWLRTVYEPFGPAPNSFWQRMAACSVRRRDDGKITLHYDPCIVDMLKGDGDRLANWDMWERIQTPTHVIRGARSDILTTEIAERMQANGPKPKVTEYDDCGHAPSLVCPQQHADLRSILQELSGAPITALLQTA